jgi:hypothetical protein
MKKTLPLLLAMLLTPSLVSCSGWVIQPGTQPTPFLPPTNTPSIFSPTPVVVGASPTSTPQVATATAIPFITATTAPTLIPSDTPIVLPTDTSPPSGPSVSVEILGCNTSIDVTHGLGEVTNAFVVLRNTGMVELANLSVTLNALDEGEEHPDKTVEVPSLLATYKVMLKLTVDSTYREDTPIQVEVRGDAGLFQRVGADSCKDIGVFAPNPADLSTPIPSNP